LCSQCAGPIAAGPAEQRRTDRGGPAEAPPEPAGGPQTAAPAMAERGTPVERLRQGLLEMTGGLQAARAQEQPAQEETLEEIGDLLEELGEAIGRLPAAGGPGPDGSGGKDPPQVGGEDPPQVGGEDPP